jgi:hypothetical protein
VVNYDNGGEYNHDVYRNNEIEDFIKYHAPLANGYSVEKNNGSENTRLGSVVSYTNGKVEYYDPLRDKVDKTKIDWYNELEKERNRANVKSRLQEALDNLKNGESIRVTEMVDGEEETFVVTKSSK